MATLILLASLLLARWSFLSKRALTRNNKSESFPAKCLGHIFEWSVSLGLVLLFYHVLLGFVAFGWQWMTVEKLQWLEEQFSAIRRMAEYYNLTWGMSISFLIAVYLLSRIWIRFLARDTPILIFKKFKSAFHVLNTVVFLLSAFTLLGFEPGPTVATLDIHLRQERKDFGALRREIKNALDCVTIDRVYDKAVKASPEAGTVGDLVHTSVDEGAKLRDTYADAQSKYNIRDQRIDTLVRKSNERQATLDHASRPAAGKDSFIEGDEVSRTPAALTYNKLSKARSAVEAFRAQFRPEFLRALKRPGGKELVLEIPGRPIDSLAEALKPIAEAYPVFTPIFDILKSALTDAVEAKLAKQIDSLTDEAIEHPGDIETLLPAAAEQVAEIAPIDIGPENTRRLHREVVLLTREVSELSSSANRLSNKVHVQEHAMPPDIYRSSNRPAVPARLNAELLLRKHFRTFQVLPFTQ